MGRCPHQNLALSDHDNDFRHSDRCIVGCQGYYKFCQHGLILSILELYYKPWFLSAFTQNNVSEIHLCFCVYQQFFVQHWSLNSRLL